MRNNPLSPRSERKSDTARPVPFDRLRSGVFAILRLVALLVLVCTSSAANPSLPFGTTPVGPIQQTPPTPGARSPVPLSSSGVVSVWAPTEAGWKALTREVNPPRILIATGSPTPSIEFLLIRADAAISNLDLPAARHDLDLLLLKDPKHAKARDLLAFVTFLQNGRDRPSSRSLSSSPSGSSASSRSPLDERLNEADRAITALDLTAAREILNAIETESPGLDKARELRSFIDFLEGKGRAQLEADRDRNRLLQGLAAPEIDAYSGYYHRESDSGVIERTALIETTVEKLRLRGLSGGLTIEERGYEVQDETAGSRVIGATMNYSPARAHLLTVTMAPEVFDDSSTINQFGVGLYSRIKAWRLGVESETNSLRDNLYTIRNRMRTRDLNLSASTKLDRRLEFRQRLLWGTVSDGNGSLSIDSRLKFRFLPAWALDLRFAQAAFDHQTDEVGDSLGYWAPKKYQSMSLALGWKKRLSKQWRCEIETSLSGSGTQEYADESQNLNAGVGILVHAGYLLPAGDIGITYADKVYLSAREKRLNIGGSLRFF